MAKIRREGSAGSPGGRRRSGPRAHTAYDYEADTRRRSGHTASGGRKISTAAAQKQKQRRRSSRRALFFQALLSILLLVQVWRTQMVPAWMLAALGLVLFILWFFTLEMQKYPKRGAFTRFCAWLLTAAMAVGCLFTQQGLDALQKVTSGENNTVVGVYVLQEDPARKISDTANYAFGCISEMDRTNTDKAITAIAAKSEAASLPSGYDNMFELVGGLYNGEVQAIILNQSFISMIEDEENGYADFSERTRCIFTYSIANDNLQGNVTGAEAKQITQKPFLIYLSGVDTRGDLTDTCRSDVNILAAVNPVTKHIVLINTPRDYYVPLAGTDGAMDKLTHAGLYGVDRSMDTLGALYGVEVSYFIKINFVGFIGIVDALGGIDVESDQAFTSVGSPGYYNPTTFVQGTNHLDGAAALAFSRERHAFKAGDIQRGENQMKVISAIVNKAKSPAVLRNYSKLMNSVGDSFVTNLSHDQVGALVRMQLNDGADWTIESYSVTGTGAKSTECYSARGSNLYVMKPDTATVAEAQAMIASVLSGAPAGSEAPTA
ncbi:MAG: LCP family protein [Faecalibacterium sp.]|jgi:LCP family protein required for cell wall assembly|nr:LCP family protein [Faecalibacterium sp.]